ncbi:MAG: flavin reductase [Lactobacillales bacterium]|jgi:flavin reductase (DIM6/NTAB) family NADH-FMN oxidoreductase RutF|nr:flavin reductase [Lactobacillales bacterium]
MSYKVTEKRESDLFEQIKPFDITNNPFHLFARDWFLIAAEKDGHVNAMTVGWGGFGVMWTKNVVFVAVRPERYTKEFLDAADTFSLTVFPNDKEMKKMLVYFGTVSGRDEDKISKSGLTVVYDGNTPYFEECQMTINCKRIMDTQFLESDFHGNEAYTKKYYGGENNASGEGGGYHSLYIAEIEKVLVKKK